MARPMRPPADRARRAASRSRSPQRPRRRRKISNADDDKNEYLQAATQKPQPEYKDDLLSLSDGVPQRHKPRVGDKHHKLRPREPSREIIQRARLHDSSMSHSLKVIACIVLILLIAFCLPNIFEIVASGFRPEVPPGPIHSRPLHDSNSITATFGVFESTMASILPLYYGYSRARLLYYVHSRARPNLLFDAVVNNHCHLQGMRVLKHEPLLYELAVKGRLNDLLHWAVRPIIGGMEEGSSLTKSLSILYTPVALELDLNGTTWQSLAIASHDGGRIAGIVSARAHSETSELDRLELSLAKSHIESCRSEVSDGIHRVDQLLKYLKTLEGQSNSTIKHFDAQLVQMRSRQNERGWLSRLSSSSQDIRRVEHAASLLNRTNGIADYELLKAPVRNLRDGFGRYQDDLKTVESTLDKVIIYSPRDSRMVLLNRTELDTLSTIAKMSEGFYARINETDYRARAAFRSQR